MRALYRLLVAALVRRRTITLEWYVALQTSGLGVWILIVIGYALVRRPERAGPSYLLWAGAALVLMAHGGFNTAVLAKGRHGRPRSPRNLTLCRRCMFGTALLWSVLTILSGLTRPFGLYWPILLGVVGAALWSYMRLAVRFKED